MSRYDNATGSGRLRSTSCALTADELWDQMGKRGPYARVSVVKLTAEGAELVRQAEGDLQTRLTRLVADWPADRREAVGDVLAELVWDDPRRHGRAR